MAVRVVFLGRLADIAGASELEIAWLPADSIETLTDRLAPALRAAVTQPQIRVAINGVLAPEGEDKWIDDGDELAFLPPVSGG